ncbi:MAG TPA: nuclear transport factor 2 family protein [Chitinophagaceae bacterium]|nr:nuclear transport factor 2 family protein [Chitinophagaceae bacterium]
MDNPNNLQIIQQMYQSFASGNKEALMNFFDPSVVWLEPGAPDIPFAGSFEGLSGIGKMFALEAQYIKVTSFIPQSFCSSGDMVVVMGKDSVNVIPTGKTYSTDWVQAFTLSNGKIIRIQVYMDTHAIAQAFMH